MKDECKNIINGGKVLLMTPSFIFQDQTESAAILKIKESMQEEAKRFEKDTPSEGGSHSDYFGMQ